MNSDDIDCKKCDGEKRILVPIKPAEDEKKVFILVSQVPKEAYNKKTKKYTYGGREWKEVLCPRCNGRGTELPNKNRNNSKRGKGFERRVGADFKKWWQQIEPDCDFQRTPSSGGSALAEGWGLYGDLCTNSKTFPFHLECKLEKIWDFEDFFTPKGGRIGAYIKQSLADCPLGKIPMVIFCHPGPSQRAYVMLVVKHEWQLFLLAILEAVTQNYRNFHVTLPCGESSIFAVVLPLETLLSISPSAWRDAGAALARGLGIK